MRTLAHVDTRNGKVYRIPFKSLASARAMVHGPYHRQDRVVLVTNSRVECYDRGELVTHEEKGAVK